MDSEKPLVGIVMGSDSDWPLVKKACETLEKFGVSYETRVHGSRGIPGDWRKTKVAGGGMVYDWAVHMLDQALWLFGYDVKSVYCTLDNITNDEVDDGCQITVTLTSGVRLYVEIGTRNFIPMPRMYCRGTMGTAISEAWQSPVRVTVCEQWTDGGVVVPVKTAAGITKTMAPRGEETVSSYEVPQPAADVHDYYRNFADAIDGKAEQIVTHAQMRRVMEAECLPDALAACEVVPAALTESVGDLAALTVAVINGR